MTVAVVVHAAPDNRSRLPIAPASSGTANAPSEKVSESGDDVVRRLHSLLASSPLSHGILSIVPLHARRPSEARAGSHALPAWRPRALQVRRVADGVVRLRHDQPHAVLILPGLFLRSPTLDARLLRPAVVDADAPLYIVARTRGVGRVQETESLREDQAAKIERGLLHAEEIGHSLASTQGSSTGGTGPWADPTRRGVTDGGPTYRGMAGLMAPLLRSAGDETLVGCVVLIAGRPVSAHCFASQRLFADAWPDILSGAVRTAYQGFARGTPRVVLERSARRAAVRGRAVYLLRRASETEARRIEVPGGGYQWEVGGTRHGLVGRALVDAHRRVLYAGIFAVTAVGTTTARGAPPKADAEEEDDARTRRARFNPFRKTTPLPDRLPPR